MPNGKASFSILEPKKSAFSILGEDKSLRSTIDSTIDEVVDFGFNRDDNFRSLMKETAAHEAHFGKLDPVNPMQVDDITYRNFEEEPKVMPLLKALGAKVIDGKLDRKDLKTNIVTAAMKYNWNDNIRKGSRGFKASGSQTERAQQWKDIYNTEAGKGTPEKFLKSQEMFDMREKPEPKAKPDQQSSLIDFILPAASAAEVGSFSILEEGKKKQRFFLEEAKGEPFAREVLTPEQKFLQRIEPAVELIGKTGLLGEEELAERKKGQRRERIFQRVLLPAAFVAGGVLPASFALGIEGINQLKNVVVSAAKKEKFDPVEIQTLSSLLPADTPTPLKVVAGITEVVGDILIVGGLLSLAKQGLLKASLKEVGTKLSTAGYGEGKITITKEAIKRAARGSTLEREIARFAKSKGLEVPATTGRQVPPTAPTGRAEPIFKQPSVISQPIREPAFDPAFAGPRAGGLPIKPSDVPTYVKKVMERGVEITSRDAPILMDKAIQVKDIHGNKVTLPKGEEYTPFKLSNGKVWLHDGKNVVIDKNQLSQVKGEGTELKAFETPEEAQVTEVIKTDEDVGQLEKQFETVADQVNASIRTTGLNDPRTNELRKIRNDLRDKIDQAKQQGQPKFSQYQLPGGTNYKETLIKVPSKIGKEITLPEKQAEAKKLFNKDYNSLSEEDRINVDIALRDKQRDETLLNQFKSPHWEEPNVIAHIRTNERTGPKGEKILFIEEIQSDWADAGRKKGFATDISESEKTKIFKENQESREVVFNKLRNLDSLGFDSVGQAVNAVMTHEDYVKRWELENESELIKAVDRYKEAINKVDSIKQGVPSHPLLKNWKELALKKVIKQAIEGGYDTISWTTGDQQADRFDLSKQLEKIRWESDIDGVKDIDLHKTDGTTPFNLHANKEGIVIDSHKDWNGKHLSDVIGKGVSKKILSESKGIIKEEGLKIGGEGKKVIYDINIPSILKKLTGGEVGKTSLGTAPAEVDLAGEPTLGERELTQQSLALTPQVKAKILGQPKAGGLPIRKEPVVEPEGKPLIEVLPEPEVKPELQPLIEEAKKFDTAEKFVEAQNKKTTDIIRRAKKNFPPATFAESAFILPDGTTIAGLYLGPSLGITDHDTQAALIAGGKSKEEALVRTLNSGIIRNRSLGNSVNIEIIKKPTKEQMEIIEIESENKPIVVDVSTVEKEGGIASGRFLTFREFKQFINKTFEKIQPVGLSESQLIDIFNKAKAEKLPAKKEVTDPKAIIEKAGGTFRGLSKGLPAEGGQPAIEGIVQFDDPETGTILAMKENELTAKGVRKKIAKSRADFAAEAKPPAGEPPERIPPSDVAGSEGPEGEGAEAVAKYETQKDIWIGNKDVRVLQSKIEKRALQKEIPAALGKEKYDADVEKYDKAIQIYVDSKRNPEHITKFWDKLTKEQQEIVTLSQNLPENVRAIADKISASYRQIGLEAQDVGIIRNVLDNYAARVWKIEGKSGSEKFRKFATTTRHAKTRRLGTIIEGWASGLELKVEGATSNLQILKEEIVKTIEDKNFLNALKKIRTAHGEPILSAQQLEGYVKVEHPNFKVWRHAGVAPETEATGKVFGKNFFRDEEGRLWERRDLYAPKDQAQNINTILGISKLKGIPAIDFVTKYNAVFKAWILQSSFFHHLAFTRSYWLGTQHKLWNEMSIRQAYRLGIKAIEEQSPVVMLGVKNGLTLGLKQDWDEEILRETSKLDAYLDKIRIISPVKKKVLDLRQKHVDFLFGEFGAGLKAKAFMIEFRNLTKKHPDKTADELAKMAANLINDDFGGLHLQRLGRNPTLQHIFRIFALAPDWTESNIRTMIKSFKAGSKEETQFYRNFWAGIFTKAAMVTVLGNALMAGMDEDDKDARGWYRRMVRNYKRAWKEGKLRWADIDITPIYRGLGGATKNRKYFSVFGHFKDPIKFITHPIRSAKHKGSVVYGMFHEALTGVDWAGRRFTTTSEILGVDKEKGRYKTTRKGFYKKGDPKWGKLKWKTVTWDFKGKGPLNYEQIIPFAISQVKGVTPVQVQNLMSWMSGEMEGFDALLKSAGLRISTTYEKPEKGKQKWKVSKKKKKKKRKWTIPK